MGTEALVARDEALSRIAGKNQAWMAHAMNRLSTFIPGQEYTGEEIRIRLRLEVGEPSHHNAWGAFIRSAAVSYGLIEPTGEHRHMATKRSHARMTPVYRRTHTQMGENHVANIYP